MNRTKAFVNNSFAAIIYQIVNFFVGFIVPRLIISNYGSEINGLTSSITQFVLYFSLVEAGLSNASIFALYKPLYEKDKNKISSIVSATNKLYKKSGYVFLGITIIFSIIYPFFVDTAYLNKLDITLLTLILATSATLDFFTLSKYRALLTADQKTHVISYANIIHNIVNTLILIVLADKGLNIVLLRAIALSAVFIRTAILKIYCKKNYHYLYYKATPDNNALNKRWDALFLQILGAVHNGAPIIIATIFTNLTSVSIYSVYNLVVSGVSRITDIFSSGLTSGFGNVIASGEKNVLRNAYSEFEFIYYTLITIVYSITAITITSFVKVYTQDVADINYVLPLTGFLIATNGLLYSLKTPQGMMVISAGLYRETRWQTTTQGLIAIITSLIFVNMFGLNGIIIGSILSNIYRDIDLLIFIPKYILDTSFKQSMYRIFRTIGLYFILLAVNSWVKVDITNYLSWLIYAGVIGIIVSIITVSVNVLFERQCAVSAFNRLKGVMKK